jgi:hypothetical protein
MTFTVNQNKFDSWAEAKAAAIRSAQETGKPQALFKEGRTEPYWFQPREEEKPAPPSNLAERQREFILRLIARVETLEAKVTALEAPKPKRAPRKAA